MRPADPVSHEDRGGYPSRQTLQTTGAYLFAPGRPVAARRVSLLAQSIEERPDQRTRNLESIGHRLERPAARSAHVRPEHQEYEGKDRPPFLHGPLGPVAREELPPVVFGELG